MATAAPGEPRILRVLEVIAQIYILLTVLGVLFALTGTLLSEGSIMVELPVQQFLPQPMPGVEITSPPPAEIRSGGFLQGEFAVVGLSLATRLWLAGGVLAYGVVGVLLGIAFIRVVRGATTTTPFPVRLAASLRLAGITLLIGGVAWQVLNGIGQAQAAREAFAVSGYTTDTTVLAIEPDQFPPNAGLPRPGVVSSIEFTPVWIGLALLGLSSAVAHNSRREEPGTAGSGG